ncbi:ATP-binding protein [Humisphaera borealis]|uniref:AAA family ATPase n=1 Tax=Humisphaera borealis TaxID=2807512 RepID=A0A7M2X2Y0_9BACT|nr:AAA family ATPase [Humisphaera borealis]
MKVGPQIKNLKASRGAAGVVVPDWVDQIRPPRSEALVYPKSLQDSVDDVGRMLSLPAPTAPRVLLFGPPGVGKTATLRNWAFGSTRPFWWVRADRLITSFLGGTVSNLTHLFRAAREVGAVLVFDDLDAYARRRDDPREGGESRRTVVGLLSALDETAGSVAVVAATNLPESVDPAALRRFQHMLAFRPLGVDHTKLLVRQASGVKRVSPELVRLARKMSPAEVVDALQHGLKVADTAAAARSLRARADAMSMIGKSR